MERLRVEREAAEFEHNRQTASTKQKMDRAIVSCILDQTFICLINDIPL